MKRWLVLYDIKEEKRLNQVARTLKMYGHRIQYSVFMVLCEYSVMEMLRDDIRDIIEEEDSVVYYRICESDWKKKFIFGKHFETEINAEYVIY